MAAELRALHRTRMVQSRLARDRRAPAASARQPRLLSSLAIIYGVAVRDRQERAMPMRRSSVLPLLLVAALAGAAEAVPDAEATRRHIEQLIAAFTAAHRPV